VTHRSPSTFLVGAGPVATALAGALRLGGVPVLGLWARRPAAARAAGAIAGVAAFSSAPPDLLLEADVVLIAVRDGAIGEVAERLVGTGLVSRRHVFLHCSGARSSAEAFAPVLAGGERRVGGVGTLHPLRAIADGRTAMRSLKGTFFGVEGDERGRAAAQLLVAALGGQALALDGQHMPAYHAACAFASNYLVTLLDAAVATLGRAGLPEREALAALVPLAQGALANVAERGVAGGLTGPIRRGDELTVARHLEAIAGERALVELYEALGRRTCDIAARLSGDDAPDAHGLTAIRRRLGLELRAASGE
jgi:predicted short-subunit dehydrogenase-like oxidoreductase (DUF2520 family)